MGCELSTLCSRRLRAHLPEPALLPLGLEAAGCLGAWDKGLGPRGILLETARPYDGV